MQEVLRHPFLIHQLGPIELFPYKPHADAKEINKTVVRYLAFKSVQSREDQPCDRFFFRRHGYSEHEIEDAVLHRKPIAARALYSLIERRLKEGLGWPDRTYNHSVVTMSSLGNAGTADGPSDIIALDKFDRQEPLLPGRRTARPPGSSLSNTTARLSREKSHYAFDEQVLVRTQNSGHTVPTVLTQDALNELAPASRIASKKLFQDIVTRKSSAVGNRSEPGDESPAARRVANANSLAPIKAVLSNQRANEQRGNIVVLQQQQKLKPRSLPNSTLDHANQNAFHLPQDPYGSRAPKTPSRTSHAEPSKRNPSQSPVRYNPGSCRVVLFIIGQSFLFVLTVPTTSCLFRLRLNKSARYRKNQVSSSMSPSMLSISDGLFSSPSLVCSASSILISALFSTIAPSVTVKAIGLFLKNSALQSRVSSCSSRSSKSTGPTHFDAPNQSPPLKFYPASGHSNARQTMINYHSQANLTSNNNPRQAFVSTTTSPHRLSASKVQHTTTTTTAAAAATTNGHKLMPT